MKATGIVRRIDDLGRVVIPKEIRRTMRIREGDPLEIFTDKDGVVILKKYSPIYELGNFAQEYAEALNHSLKHIACICDKDIFVAVSGTAKKEFIERGISSELEEIINDRKTVVANGSEEGGMYPLVEDGEDASKYTSQVIVPIINMGDSVGAVILLSKDPDVSMGNTEIKVAETTAEFLARQLEQ